jgi:hypothetical protein
VALPEDGSDVGSVAGHRFIRCVRARLWHDRVWPVRREALADDPCDMYRDSLLLHRFVMPLPSNRLQEIDLTTGVMSRFTENECAVRLAGENTC